MGFAPADNVRCPGQLQEYDDQKRHYVGKILMYGLLMAALLRLYVLKVNRTNKSSDLGFSTDSFSFCLNVYEKGAVKNVSTRF